MEDGHPLPTVLVSSELKRQLNFHQEDENDKEDKRRKTKRRGIFQLEPGNTVLNIVNMYKTQKYLYFRLYEVYEKI